jgi:hypothetical protein
MPNKQQEAQNSSSIPTFQHGDHSNSLPMQQEIHLIIIGS